MNTLFLILLAYALISIIIAGMVRRAPTGYEDEAGFQAGEMPRERTDLHRNAVKR